MSARIVYPKVKYKDRIVDITYATEYGSVMNKPPITYDKNAKMTKVNSKLYSQGDITTGGKVFSAVWNDYAELFLKGEDLNPGDVVVYNPDDKKIYKSNSIADKLVVGVVSDTYGQILGGDEDKSLEENLKTYSPIGLAGRVSVNITDNDNIYPGCLLTSSVNGTATRYDPSCHAQGSIIGKAIGHPRNGKVLMLILLG